MKDADALAKIVATDPRCAGFQRLWSLRMPMPDEAQKAWLFGGDVGSTFTVAAVSEHHPPFVLPAAAWSAARKSYREREHDVMMLYVGWLIWSRREQGPPSASMLRVAEQVARRAAKHPQAASVDVVDVIHVKGFGGDARDGEAHAAERALHLRQQVGPGGEPQSADARGQRGAPDLALSRARVPPAPADPRDRLADELSRWWR